MPTADDNIRLQITQIFTELLQSVARVSEIVSEQQQSQSSLRLEAAYFESFMTDNKKVVCRTCGYRGRLAWLGSQDAFIGCARCGSTNWCISLTAS